MKKLITVIICLLFSTTIIGCTQEKSYNVYAPDGAPLMAIAKLMHNDDIAGADFSYNVINSDAIIPTMTNADADFIIAPTNVGVKLSVMGGNYVFAGTTSWGNLYIVSNNDNVKARNDCQTLTEFLNQFKQKTVYSIGTGAVPDITFKHILSQNDVTVDIQPLDASQIILKLKQRQIDFGILGEPAATNAVEISGGKIICSISSIWAETTGYDFPQASLFIKKSIADKDKTTALLFIDKLISSIEYLNQSEENAFSLGDFIEKSGKSSLTATIMKKTYLKTNQKYVSAIDAKDSVKNFCSVLNVGFNDDIIFKP